jgi:CubicO group peptidase (beta-lactamase class C family)
MQTKSAIADVEENLGSGLMIAGECAPGYAPLAEAFAANFRLHGEIGASLCVYSRGKKVVDLWGGFADAARTRPWQGDTLVNVWSTTKGILALCVARLADQELLSLDSPVVRYWPEFGAAGKETITVAQLFSHQAGLCGPARQLTEAELLDSAGLADLLAAQPPLWPPGTRSGYHALTIGPLADALFLRVTGRTVGTYFHDEIAGPLGLDFHMGLPEAADGRVAEIVHDGNPLSGLAEFNIYQHAAQILVPVRPGLANLPAWRRQGTPSAAGQGNARAIACIYGALAHDLHIGDTELVSRAALERAVRGEIMNEDLVLRMPMAWGIGFALNRAMGVYGPSPRAFGHHGWGGSFAFADPDTGTAIAYAMNFMREPAGGLDPRFAGLVGALYASPGLDAGLA